MPRYIIVGNGVAGTSAAEAIRKLDPTGPIDIFSDEDVPFYYRIKLPEVVTGEIHEDNIIAKKPNWYEDQGMSLHLMTRIVEIDADKKALMTKDGQKFLYDRLLLATGSHSFIPPIQGSDKPGLFTLRNMQDVRTIRKWAEKAEQAVLIGGGLLGLEAGNGLRKLGKKVTVVEVFPRLLPRQLDTEGASRLQSMLEDMGFAFCLGAKTTSIEGQDAVEKVILDTGSSLPADLILVSAGVRPNLELARQLHLDMDKGIKVDEYLQTNRPDIYAAGDVTEFAGRVYGIWPAAQDQGRLAGRNMAANGQPQAYQGTVMANTLKVVGIDLASAGEIDAEGQYDARVKADDHCYRKIVLDGRTIIGCIMLGDTRGFQKVTKLIQEQADASDVIDSLLSGAL
ncbi:MAG: FAD-dependent oxidoreductase [Desulfovermiculus sp.]|nr:FAD-dependent oxidoreductase [Desulfovermiculus sp.]